jgi:hypothetical protein
MKHTDPSHNGLWLAIIMLSSIFAATAAGEVIHMAGATVAASVEAACGLFVSFAGLGIAARKFTLG